MQYLHIKCKQTKHFALRIEAGPCSTLPSSTQWTMIANIRFRESPFTRADYSGGEMTVVLDIQQLLSVIKSNRRLH